MSGGGPDDPPPACAGATELRCDGVCVDVDADPAHCGACGVVYDGGLDCVAGECACVSGVFEGEVCCVVEDPLALDVPDLEGEDTNCDGVDGVAAELVFVALDGDDAAGDGTREAPYRSIQHAIDVAAGRTPVAGVAIGAGDFEGTVRLADGVSLFGGYEPSAGWRRSTEVASRITVSTAEGAHQVGVHAVDIAEPTTVQLVEVLVGDASGPNVTTYGVRALRADGLHLDHVAIAVGRGGDGSHGREGATGAHGGRGAGGVSYAIYACEGAPTGVDAELTFGAPGVPGSSSGGVRQGAEGAAGELGFCP